MRALVAGVVSIATVGSAWADDREGPIAPTGTYVKLGGEAGVAGLRDRGAGLQLGVAGTIVHFDSDSWQWWGVQADLLGDSNGDWPAGAQWSIGPEMGIAVIGGDLSYFGERVGGETRHGAAVRLKLTLGYPAVYLRYRHVFAGDDRGALELGVQLKLPLLEPDRPDPYD